MKHKWLIILLLGLVSCTPNNVPDTTLRESYQIGNESSNKVTLHFYSNGAPNKVYAEIYDRTNPVFVTPENAEKPRGELLNVSSVSLNSGQTVLFYKLVETYEHEYVGDTIPHSATCLFDKHYYYIFAAKSVLGDSVVVSIENKPDSVVPMSIVTDIWETWYNDKDFIYYHYWRITK